jgi:hypothetical protein
MLWQANTDDGDKDALKTDMTSACERGRDETHMTEHTSAFVSIRQHTSAYVSIRQRMSAYVRIRQDTSAYVSISQYRKVEDVDVNDQDIDFEVCDAVRNVRICTFEPVKRVN